MNGYVQAKYHKSGGINADGEPIPATIKWGKKAECRYEANTLNNRGRYDDGKFTNSEYIITVFDMGFSAEYIRLIDSRGDAICEKPVQSIEILESIQRVKITV